MPTLHEVFYGSFFLLFTAKKFWVLILTNVFQNKTLICFGVWLLILRHLGFHLEVN